MDSKFIKKGIDDFFEEQNQLYPNRHKEIHKVACKNCPSTFPRHPLEKGYDDAIKQLPKDIIAKEHLFVCGWRGSKLCKGFCDEMEINQEQLNHII